MKAWERGDELLRERAQRRMDEDAGRLAELEAEGIDLDPAGRGRGRAGHGADASADAAGSLGPRTRGTRITTRNRKSGPSSASSAQEPSGWRWASR